MAVKRKSAKKFKWSRTDKFIIIFSMLFASFFVTAPFPWNPFYPKQESQTNTSDVRILKSKPDNPQIVNTNTKKFLPASVGE